MNRLTKTRTAFAERFEELKSYNATHSPKFALLERLLDFRAVVRHERAVTHDCLGNRLSLDLFTRTRTIA